MDNDKQARAEAKAVALLKTWENRVYLNDFEMREELKGLIARAIMEQDCHTRYACAAAALQLVGSYGEKLKELRYRVHEAVLQTREGL